jgi:hypothetical protein
MSERSQGRKRRRFSGGLLEDTLPSKNASDQDPLYLAALAMENEHMLSAEMDDWEVSTIADGVGEGDTERWVARAGG